MFTAEYYNLGVWLQFNLPIDMTVQIPTAGDYDRRQFIVKTSFGVYLVPDEAVLDMKENGLTRDEIAGMILAESQ